MKTQKLPRARKVSRIGKSKKILLVLGFFALVLSIRPVLAALIDSAADTPLLAGIKSIGVFENAIAENGLQQAWEDARNAGGYSFRADVVQVAIPLAQPTNIGQTSREYTYHIEGTTDGLASSDPSQRLFEMFLWDQGGSVLDPSTAAQFKVENGVALARRGDQDWTQIDDMSSSIAPEGDFLTYLSGAQNVVNVGMEERQGISFTRYTFDIDGPSYAAYTHDQMQARLAQQGKLPVGVNMGLPEIYKGMTGAGELWVGADGLPLRQIITANFPAQGRQDYRTDVRITTDFHDFSETQTFAGIPGSLSRNLGNMFSAALDPLATVLSITFLAGLGVFFVRKEPRLTYNTLALSVIFSTVMSPLLQVHQVSAFENEQRAQAAAQQEQQQQQEASQEFADQLRADIENFDPHVSSLNAAAQRAVQGAAQDVNLAPPEINLTNLAGTGIVPAMPVAAPAAQAAPPPLCRQQR